MDVEQTTQLIQLILNSVLMINACALLLAGLLSRQTMTSDRLKTANREYAALVDMSHISRNVDITAAKENHQFHFKKQVRQLQQRHRTASNNVLMVYYALLLFVGSTFLLALRAVFSLDWLIPGSLGLFGLGVSVLLLGVVLTLYDLHQSDRSLWQEIKELLNAGKSSNESRRELRLQRSRPQDAHQAPFSTKSQTRPKAKVG